jgi:hypothetical protein
VRRDAVECVVRDVGSPDALDVDAVTVTGVADAPQVEEELAADDDVLGCAPRPIPSAWQLSQARLFSIRT